MTDKTEKVIEGRDNQRVLVLDNDIGFEGMSSQKIADIVRKIQQDGNNGNNGNNGVDIYASRNNVFPEEIDVYDAIIISGSSASAYHQDPWIEKLKDMIKESGKAGDTGKSIFGICFGCQIISSVYGAKVLSSGGYEVGWKNVTLSDDPLFDGLLKDACQYEIHKDIIANVPDNIEVIAENEFSIQAIRVKGTNICGVQFHPEIDKDTGRYILESRKQQLDDFGISIDDCVSSYDSNRDYGTIILRNFLKGVGKQNE